LIVDEAHNILNKNNLIKIINSFPKVLLVTATPPSQMEEIMFCDTIYKYKLSDALNDKFICDYIIYLPLIDQKDDLNIIDIEQPDELID
jgi:superfamily II DNA or RNA helicase